MNIAASSNQHGVGVGGGSVPDFLNAEISQDDFVNSSTSGQKWSGVRKPSVGQQNSVNKGENIKSKVTAFFENRDSNSMNQRRQIKANSALNYGGAISLGSLIGPSSPGGASSACSAQWGTWLAELRTVSASSLISRTKS